MAFPALPWTNGQQTTVNNISYTYNSTKGAWVRGVQSGAVASLSSLTLTSGTASTSTTSGALIVTGGVGVSGALYVGGTFSAPSGTASFSAINATTIGASSPGTGAFTSLTTSLTVTASGVVTASSGTASTTTGTGALVVSGGMGISGAIVSGGAIKTTGNIVGTSGTTTSGANTGALVITGDAYISGNVVTGTYNTYNARVTVNLPSYPITSTTVYVLDPRAEIGKNISGVLSGYTTSPTTVFAGDELEMDVVNITGNVVASGNIAFFLSASPGYIRGSRNITYYIA